MYYTGVPTLVMSAGDMAARAQIIRRHDYAMAGARVPPHAIPPAPSASVKGGRLYWRGSAGARNYSIQRAPSARGPWSTVCRRCVTDRDDGWVDPSAGAVRGWYRVVPFNLDGKPGPASKPQRATTG
jgi:mannan endo-1,4-beta-mannosidase